MKKSLLYIAVPLILFACAPVLNRSYLNEAEREVSFNSLRSDPEAHRGRLYVFGGVIIQTRLLEDGSRIEAMHIPVDRYGHFKETGRSQGRFLAIMPKEQSILDPEIFTDVRRITIAGEFTGVQKARIDEMDYAYPVFEIKEIHLWPKERTYYPTYYYDPWFYPYPYFYRNPWWGYPYYYYRGDPPAGYRRRQPPAGPDSSEPPFERRRRAPDAGHQDPGIERAPDRGTQGGTDMDRGGRDRRR